MPIFSASRVREGFASRVRENFSSRVRENMVACLRIAYLFVRKSEDKLV